MDPLRGQSCLTGSGCRGDRTRRRRDGRKPRKLHRVYELPYCDRRATLATGTALRRVPFLPLSSECSPLRGGRWCACRPQGCFATMAKIVLCNATVSSGGGAPPRRGAGPRQRAIQQVRISPIVITGQFSARHIPLPLVLSVASDPDFNVQAAHTNPPHLSCSLPRGLHPPGWSPWD
jgi:hypothetical protein